MTGPLTPPTDHRRLHEWDTAATSILHHRPLIITRGLIITARVLGFILGRVIIGHAITMAGDTIAAAGRISRGPQPSLRPHLSDTRYDSLHPCYKPGTKIAKLPYGG